MDGIIGRRKYEQLKSFPYDNYTEDELDYFQKTFNITLGSAIKKIEAYELVTFRKTSDKEIEYWDSLENKPDKELPYIDKKWLYNRFKKCFNKNEGIEFKENDFTLENIKPLIYYFIGDYDNFIKCKNVSSLSKPSLSKGLLIIGGYGNGKTTVMKAIEKAMRITTFRFKSYSANDVVKMYEACNNAIDKDEFNKIMNHGILMFDDLLTEREASNYGKANIFKDIIEERNFRKKRTYITCNYKDGTDQDLKKGLEQFGDKYGSRVYDRLYSDFNIIEFKGESFRN